MRVVAVESLGQLVPLYPLYPLLFRDHGLSDGAISALFVLWSLTGVVLEVPSGAWADAFSRRRLLALSGVLSAAAFALWVLVPSTAAFAVGFVLWGAGTALASGTLEALLYDALAAHDAVERYATLRGRARAGGLAAALVGTALAAPLVSAGGYVLPGLVGVAAVLAGAALALTLPEPARTAGPEDGDAGGGETDGSALRAWWAMLRAGLAEVSRAALVRRAVLAAAVVGGLAAFDEYLPLLAADGGADGPRVALLLTLVGVADVAGAALGGVAARFPARVPAALLVLAAAAVAVGSLLPAVPGFVPIAVGWGLVQTLLVVLDARVQAAVTGDARATVTSVAGLGAEATAIAAIGAIGLGSVWFALPVLVAGLMLPLAASALLIRGDANG